MKDFKLTAEEVAKPDKPLKVHKPDVEVFSSGGGTQSTAIAALIVQGKLPKPDHMVICDTGREMPTTWRYLNEVTIPEMEKIGIPVHRIKAHEYANNWGHPSMAGFAGNGNLLLPSFSSINNSKLPAFCSKAWKSEVAARFLKKEFGLTRSKYRTWIGFSRDEDTRIFNMQKGKEWRQGLIRFPLVDDVPTKRHESIRIVEKMGWPTPPRSRCWMCPNQSDFEWHEVQQDYPKLFAEAIDLDEAIREKDPDAYMHSSIKPLRDADLSQRDDMFSASCPSGECFL